jgi:SAM-dependent methyltransferase
VPQDAAVIAQATLSRELRNGKSLQRAILNMALAEVELGGRILDVGGVQQASYRRFIRTARDGIWTVANYDAASGPDLCFDAGQRWPTGDASYDCVLLINCLYIFPDPGQVIREADRTLKPGGQLIFTFPFMFHEAPEPSDYHRMTRAGAALLAESAGLVVDSTLSIGGRFCCAVELLGAYLRKLRLYSMAARTAYWLDSKGQDRSPPSAYAGTLVRAHKT